MTPDTEGLPLWVTITLVLISAVGTHFLAPYLKFRRNGNQDTLDRLRKDNARLKRELKKCQDEHTLHLEKEIKDLKDKIEQMQKGE